MRPVIILLAALVIVLGVVTLQQRRADHAQLTTAQAQTQQTSNTLQSVQSELTAYKAQQVVIATQVKQQIAGLETGKATLETQLQQTQQQTETLKQELASATKTAHEQKNQLTILAAEKETLVAKVTNLDEQLRAAQQLAAPTQPSAITQPSVVLDSQLKLELASCLARWNNPAALTDQLRAINQELRAAHIAAWKRRDAAASATGNRGVLLHDGQLSNSSPVTSPR